MLKFTNAEKTRAIFNGAGIVLAGAEDWSSIGDTPTRDAVLAWIAAGNTPELADPVPTPDYEALRAQALQAESYPIFVRWQFGEATEQEWRDKVIEINARWPAE